MHLSQNLRYSNNVCHSSEWSCNKTIENCVNFSFIKMTLSTIRVRRRYYHFFLSSKQSVSHAIKNGWLNQLWYDTLCIADEQRRILYVLKRKSSDYLLMTIATASFRTLSPNTNAYKFTSTCNALKIARMVNGSCEQQIIHDCKKKWINSRAVCIQHTVGDISAPKYSVSRNVKFNFPGRNWTAPYISEPIKSAEIDVPIIAKVRIAPKLRKKYF